MQQVDNRWGGSLQTITRQKARLKNNEKKNLDLVPDHNTETAFAEWLSIPLEERGIIKRLLTALDNDKHRLGHSGSRRERQKTTVQTKHSQHHLPPSASTARIPSRMLFLHLLHFGILNRTWQFSQYGCPLYTVNPTSASSNVPSPAKLLLPDVEEGGGRKGSPHSAQKKCCSW